MAKAPGDAPPQPVAAVLVDLLMAVMDTLAVWTAAGGGASEGLAWRDVVTDRMIARRAYASYEDLVSGAARALGLPPAAPARLVEAWREMSPWPDAVALSRQPLPFAFVTSCSRDLATTAARRSGLAPRFTLSAEEAGWYKPDPRIYLEACRRFGLPPARVALVAGSVHDAEGGARAGLPSILVRRRPDQRAPEPGIHLVSTLHEAVDWLEDARLGHVS
jgi:HAD superfamily hydrolase (TIGR01493 family)